MKNDKAYYFLLDYKKTKAAIKTKIDQYNDELEKVFLKDPAAFRDKYHIKEKKNSNGEPYLPTYKALTIKSCEETTMWVILEFFGGYLHSNANMKLTPNEFRINNQAICTKKSNRIISSTVYRHIKKLISAGVISEKIFRGSNTSFDLKLNPNLIHFRQNQDYNLYLFELYKAVLNNREVNPAVFSGTLSFSATLAHFPFGYCLASCNHISTSILLLEHKINMESGIVNFDFPSPSALSSENQINNDFLLKNLNTGCAKTVPSENTPPFCAAPPQADFQNDPLGLAADVNMQLQVGNFVDKADQQRKNNFYPKSEHEKLWKHVLSFYCFATAILWPSRIITTYERNKICANIYKHFKKELGEKDVDTGVLMFRGTFMFRILLTKKFLSKNTFWTIESPTSYFDFENKKGFNGTATWVDKSKEMEANNKLYLEHYKKFIQVWKDYTKNPNMETYRQSSQLLGKMKNECWKDYFNQGVANLNNIDVQGANQIWKNNYQA